MSNNCMHNKTNYIFFFFQSFFIEILQFYIANFILLGEQEVQSARNVVLYTSLLNKKNDQNNGITGLLVVTNFKLTFLSNKSDQVVCFSMFASIN